MKITSKNLGAAIIFLALSFPFTASAHAAPVQSEPQSSATITTSPESVSITFSERIDEAASSIQVRGPSGSSVSTGDAHVSPTDPRQLSVPVRSDGDGTYLVSWSVVSSDDGHFTKGAYPYAVGTGIAIDVSGAADTEMVQISTTPEAVAIAVELMGNGFILAVLLLFIFAVRPIVGSTTYIEHRRIIERGYLYVLCFGALLVFVGAGVQFLLKAQSLAGLRGIDLTQALSLYVHTVAGSATAYRAVFVFVVLICALVGSKRITRSLRVTGYEYLMLAAMIGFEYSRAVISHATANPFYPHLSVFVNFIHLIEKDFWAGALGILVLMTFSKRALPVLGAIIPRVWIMLAVDLVLVSITACYIVWLHLKEFANLFTTHWGATFVQLLIVAALLVAMRVYHVFARVYRPGLFARILPQTLAAEFAVAMLVVYCSSVVIITSPPLPTHQDPSMRASDHGITMTLSRDPFADNLFLLETDGPVGMKEPVAEVTDAAGEEIAVELTKRFPGGYVFPAVLLSAGAHVSITVAQTDGYDARAVFDIPARTLEPVGGEKRSFDSFTWYMIAIAITALAFSAVVYSVSARESHTLSAAARRGFPELITAAVFLVVAFAGASIVVAYASSSLSNPYKARCEADGNMWHLMLPTSAGSPVSQTPREGCMWGMGRFSYQFPDKREYDYLSTLGEAAVSLDMKPTVLRTGVPIDLTFSLKNSDGTPATLLVDMEKYMHVVIISSDESEFAHIHPDDLAPLTQDAINTSTFTVRYTFPKAGTYLVSVDYAHGTNLESKQFPVTVTGSPSQQSEPLTFASPGTFHGYEVSMEHAGAYSGEVTTLKFNVSRDGVPVKNMQPYLSAVSHVSVIKNDLSAFIHTHGEVHAPGVAVPPVNVVNGKIVHSMSSMTAPAAFGPTFDAHVLFPSRGRYTVWAQIKIDGVVIPTSFTVDVDE